MTLPHGVRDTDDVVVTRIHPMVMHLPAAGGSACGLPGWQLEAGPTVAAEHADVLGAKPCDRCWPVETRAHRAARLLAAIPHPHRRKPAAA